MPDPLAPSPDPTHQEDAMLTLENTYEWQPRAVIGGIVTAVVVVATFFSHAPGWLGVDAAVVLFYLLYCGLLWLRTRGSATFDESGNLTVRGLLGSKTLGAGEVSKVKEIINGRSPDVRLVSERGSVLVPTSKLRAGHSTLFQWLEEAQPQAVYDKGATKLRDRLRAGGYLDGTRDPFVDETWGIKDLHNRHDERVNRVLGRTGNHHDF